MAGGEHSSLDPDPPQALSLLITTSTNDHGDDDKNTFTNVRTVQDNNSLFKVLDPLKYSANRVHP